MSSLVGVSKLGAGQAQAQSRPVSTIRFDWAASILSVLITCGLYLDGWAHNHGKVDQTFFTPWHAVLYGAVLVYTLFLVLNQLQRMARGVAWQYALPDGYRLSLAGALLFMFGGALDLVWHTLFGIEVDLEALLSPTHLLLATSGVLMVSGPLRAAWSKWPIRETRGWTTLGPAILSLTMVFSILTFFTQFAHPLTHTYAAKEANALKRNGDIYVMNADGSGQTRLTTRLKQGGWGPAASPDGRKIAFTSSSETDPEAKAELFLMDADGSNWTQLTHNRRTNYLPAWSPDGSRVAFISRPGGSETSDVYLIDADGSHETRPVATEGQDYGVSWSPDGTSIVFGSAPGGTWQIYRMDLNGSGSLQQLPSGGGNAPAWSPDGSKIAFTSDRYGHDDIFVMDADGSHVRRLTKNDAYDDNSVWSPDGSQIIFSSDRDGQGNVFVMNADGSEARNLSQDPTRYNGIPAWSPDGKRILYTATVDTPNQSGTTKSLGVASILLQAILLSGFVLLAVIGWALPFGTLTVIMFLNGALMTVLHDHYMLLPGVLLAGLLADLLLVWLKPSVSRRWQLCLFAFAVPAVFYCFYFLALQLTGGIGWSLPLWLGSIFMAGILGLLLSFLGVQLDLARQLKGRTNDVH